MACVRVCSSIAAVIRCELGNIISIALCIQTVWLGIFVFIGFECKFYILLQEFEDSLSEVSSI